MNRLQGNPSKEEIRQEEARAAGVPWKKWGPYLSERQWGTVREDYSAGGDAWNFFPHDHARARAYRWGEDGIAGISDDRQLLCFSVALWNGKDPILKERLFGLTNPQGNHGEDCKEYYFYLGNTPTHAYMKYLYKYPQAAYPYDDLVATNAKRSRNELEYELLDTGVFDRDRYFDVYIEYAKASSDDILIKISAANRGSSAATLHLLPTLWFRNTWSWADDLPKPVLRQGDRGEVVAVHPQLGEYRLYAESADEFLFTENETNFQSLFNVPNAGPYTKDGINDCVVNNARGAVNPGKAGTKMAASFPLTIGAGMTRTIRLRLSAAAIPTEKVFGQAFEEIFNARQEEADEFFRRVVPDNVSDDEKNIMRQALSGMMWSKQYYNYNVEDWLLGDKLPPPPARQNGRNREWKHMACDNVISMPDKWEYPWFAGWDLEIQTNTLALIDIDFAKDQLLMLTHAAFMHPSGLIPAYEWNFNDVNPPLHAWAAWRVFWQEQALHGRGDRDFLKRIFNKLIANFTWWVNRKDAQGNNIFEGGFMGMDNIGVFDRNAVLPAGITLEQSDATSWMSLYCLSMMEMAFELAKEDKNYVDMAGKFLQHFIFITLSLNNPQKNSGTLWDDDDGFFYDTLRSSDGRFYRLKVRSMVGLLPLCAMALVPTQSLNLIADAPAKLRWFFRHHPEMAGTVSDILREGHGGLHLISVLNESKLRAILAKMLDENEFLGDYGIRSLSRYHKDHPYILRARGQQIRIDYEPAESSSGMFGGNSNWRGPVWFPMNSLLIESLLKLYLYYGDDFKVECPTGSGRLCTLEEVAGEIARRLAAIFTRDEQRQGRRPVYGETRKFQDDPYWNDLIQFHEYFHGDNGAGIGASHQTGWTGMAANLIALRGAIMRKKQKETAGIR